MAVGFAECCWWIWNNKKTGIIIEWQLWSLNNHAWKYYMVSAKTHAQSTSIHYIPFGPPYIAYNINHLVYIPNGICFKFTDKHFLTDHYGFPMHIPSAFMRYYSNRFVRASCGVECVLCSAEWIPNERSASESVRFSLFKDEWRFETKKFGFVYLTFVLCKEKWLRCGILNALNEMYVDIINIKTYI